MQGLSTNLIDERVEEYFALLEGSQLPSIAGLAYFLGFDSKEDFLKLLDNEELSNAVKRALLRVEAFLVTVLASKSYTTTGTIFLLKSTFGYLDKDSTSEDSEVAFLLERAENERSKR